MAGQSVQSTGRRFIGLNPFADHWPVSLYAIPHGRHDRTTKIAEEPKKGTKMAAKWSPTRRAVQSEPFPLIKKGCSERPGAVKGAPLLGAAQRTLDGEDRSERIDEEGKAGRKAGERWAAILVPSPAASNNCAIRGYFTSTWPISFSGNYAPLAKPAICSTHRKSYAQAAPIFIAGGGQPVMPISFLYQNWLKTLSF